MCNYRFVLRMGGVDIDLLSSLEKKNRKTSLMSVVNPFDLIRRMRFQVYNVRTNMSV